jgi:Response regulator containing CheY-like receiver domain and AraC-type DNA-binding domain
MYKLLVVDDEKWIRKGILSKLDYLGFHFAWTKEASNGEEALEIIQEDQPDIIITDVKMPMMDGIEMIRSIKENEKNIKSIIISGYAEFQYAEQALNMGVSGYILKPVAEEALSETLNNVIKELEEKKEIKAIKEKNKTLEMDNGSLIIERTVNRIFHTPESVMDDAEISYFRPYGKEIPHQYMLVLIHVDNSNYLSSDFKYQDLDLIKFAIKNIISESSRGKSIFTMNNLKDVTQIMVLIPYTEETGLNKYCNLFIYDIYVKINKYIGTSVTIAVSGITEDITQELYKQARAAFDMRLVNGNNKIYRYENIGSGEKVVLPEHKLRMLQKCIEINDVHNATVILNDIFSSGNLTGTSRNFARFLYFEVIRIILKNSGKDEEMMDSLNYEIALNEILDCFDNPAQIVRYLSTTIMELSRCRQDSFANCKEIVDKAKDYIHKNYGKDITVKDLAIKFAINPNYFSTIFKQVTGVALTKYLTDIRIEKACQLLKHTQGTISEIAQTVGYEDSQYFYRVFKKTTGQTPLEYRTKE